ncbi:MAG: hypothetical protein ACI8RZ_007126 [Myxococcota bacterium]|jgi:hypothetical protein
MPDPAITAHLRILDNLQAVVHRLIVDLVRQQALPPAFTLACRAWLLSQLRALTLQQQAIVASGGLGRRVAMYDDILYALCQDRDLIAYRSSEPDPAMLLRVMSDRLDVISHILLDFTPPPGKPLPSPAAAGLSHLLQQEAGPLSVPGALAGLIGWWTHLRSGTIELDLRTHSLSLNVEGAPLLVNALIEAGSPLGHLGGDIHVTWGHARGVAPRSGSPEVRLCDSADKARFVRLLQQVHTMTARPTPATF